MAAGVSWMSGSSTQNVVPLPSVLSTPIRPPIASMRCFGKRQPEACAFDRRVAGIEALKRHEQFRQVLRGNAASGVRDVDAQAVCNFLAGDGDGAAVAVEFHGVREQIEDDLLEALRAGKHLAVKIAGQRLQPHAALGRQRLHEGKRLFQRLAHAHRLGRERELAGLDAARYRALR